MSRDDELLRFAFGATATRDKDDLAYVRQRLHDQVIADLGDNRAGGVTWRWWPALTGARMVVEHELIEDCPQRRDLLTFLRANPGGYLVTAYAPAKREA
ncbi:MAG TPA: hypothetical protein VM307_03610 [Egibacteraceae bacterium]|nr:hypothetical protein [Egibacteraceae bacterium]